MADGSFTEESNKTFISLLVSTRTCVPALGIKPAELQELGLTLSQRIMNAAKEKEAFIYLILFIFVLHYLITGCLFLYKVRQRVDTAKEEDAVDTTELLHRPAYVGRILWTDQRFPFPFFRDSHDLLLTLFAL